MGKSKNRSWPGLIEDAKQLGVSYGHLRLVLCGERMGKRLMRRYSELVAARDAKAKEGER